MTPSKSVALFGTEEPVEEAVVLKAGPLEASLDAGNLRYIRIGGVEALRGIAFLVRDRNWGTYSPTITNLLIEQDSDSFAVSYDAECRDADQAFRYAAKIDGRADGSLAFVAEGEALSDFVTNRTGFVVLHALEGVVGAPVTVEHTDGRIVESHFPSEIDPACPFHDIRALTHEIMPGVRVACRMEGDAFEMEDHRNWMDASYKTYVRPLALPWPYTIAEGEKTVQMAALTVSGSLPAPASTGAAAPAVEVAVGDALGHAMPRLGLAAPAESLEQAIAAGSHLKRARPAFLVCRFDARAGHSAATMTEMKALGEVAGAPLVLEAVLPSVDADGNPTDDPAVLEADIAAVAEAVSGSGATFERVTVSPASDLKCTLPGSVFPPAPGWAAMMEKARAAFPGIPVGGGMFSYFTELNRKRPPADVLDFICHSGCPIVHAGDDISVMENLEALPSIFHSVRVFAGGKPYWVFPTAISMRENPYGAAPMENPDNVRQAMNRVDPRERGLIASAWYVGYMGHAARAGLDAVTLAATAGPSGIVYTLQDHEQPWFDGAGAAVHPNYHAFGLLASLSGDVLETSISNGAAVQAVATREDGSVRVVLANLTGSEQRLSLSGVPSSGQALMLDESSFADACMDAEWRSGADRADVTASSIELAPYAVAEITFG